MPMPTMMSSHPETNQIVAIPTAMTAMFATASLRAESELLERVDALVAERERVVKGLADVGLVVPEPQGNFVWFAAGDRTLELAAAADELGIVIRPFAGDGARVSVGETEANDQVIELARTFPLEG